MLAFLLTFFLLTFFCWFFTRTFLAIALDSTRRKALDSIRTLLLSLFAFHSLLSYPDTFCGHWIDTLTTPLFYLLCFLHLSFDLVKGEWLNPSVRFSDSLTTVRTPRVFMAVTPEFSPRPNYPSLHSQPHYPQPRDISSQPRPRFVIFRTFYNCTPNS